MAQLTSIEILLPELRAYAIAIPATRLKILFRMLWNGGCDQVGGQTRSGNYGPGCSVSFATCITMS